MTIKNWKNLKSWDFLNPGTYFGPLQSLLIISAKFLYKKCDKLAKVPTRVKLGVFLGIWKIGCTASVLRLKKFSYMPVLMSQGGVFHREVKPPNSEKVYPQCVVDLWLPHLRKKLSYMPVLMSHGWGGYSTGGLNPPTPKKCTTNVLLLSDYLT